MQRLNSSFLSFCCEKSDQVKQQHSRIDFTEQSKHEKRTKKEVPLTDKCSHLLLTKRNEYERNQGGSSRGSYDLNAQQHSKA